MTRQIIRLCIQSFLVGVSVTLIASGLLWFLFVKILLSDYYSVQLFVWEFIVGSCLLLLLLIEEKLHQLDLKERNESTSNFAKHSRL